MKCKLHIKNKLIRLLIMVQTVMLWQLPVYAKGGLQKSKVYTGTVNLLNDLKVVLIAVEAIVVVVLVIKEGIARQAATDPGEQAQHEKKMKGIIGLGIFITCATGLIPTIMAYYK